MRFDVTVLGGGPGGYVAAIRLAQYGLRTALIEERELGGTCLNRGCIPTKALLECAHEYQVVLQAGHRGIHLENVSFEFGKMAEYKDKTVQRLRKGIEGLERENGVTVIKGRGIFKNDTTIVTETEEIESTHIIIATGAVPSRPPIPGIEHTISSDEILDMKELPESIIIVGGGVIGIEFASLFASLGISVAVLEMLPHILPGVDEEIRVPLQKSLEKKGVKFHTNTKVISFHKEDQTIVTYETDGNITQLNAACCVVATGRTPLSKDIGLEKIGVHTERGFILTDETMRTNIPTIYAIGDITGKMQLAHVASAQGMVAAANCAGKTEKMSYDIIPACIYTDPEIAYVGLTQEKAEQSGKPIKIGYFKVPTNGKAMIAGAKEGLAKIITNAITGEIIGAHLMAPHATDMIAEIAAIMRCEGTIEELSATIHPHPTISEVWMEAAHDVDGLCIHGQGLLK